MTRGDVGQPDGRNLAMQKLKGSRDEGVNEIESGHPLFKTLPTPPPTTLYPHTPTPAFRAGQECEMHAASLPSPGWTNARSGSSASPFSEPVAPPWAPDPVGTLRDSPYPRAPRAPARAAQTPAVSLQPTSTLELLPARRFRPSGVGRGGRGRGRRGRRWDLKFRSFGRVTPILPQPLLSMAGDSLREAVSVTKGGTEAR